MEYDPIAKRYLLLKSFQNGNEALEINSVKILIRTVGNITLIAPNNERAMLDLNSKMAYFNEMPYNNSAFLARYGMRLYPPGKAELPKKMYEGIVDIFAQNNKTSIKITPGTKMDLSLTHNELETLKDNIVKHNNNSYNAREELSLKGLYLDSGSFFASKPEPFIEAGRVAYWMYLADSIDWSQINSSSPFKINFLGKDASVYEVNPPSRVLLSLDSKINFRADNDKYDNLWGWTVATTPKLFLGLDAENIRQNVDCIETPFGYVKICPRKINLSELTYLDFSKVNATMNNLTATLIQVNSSELIHGNSSRQLVKLFAADSYAYRALVLRNEADKASDAVGTNDDAKAAEINSPVSKLKLGQLKPGLYVIFAILFILLLAAFIKSRKEDGEKP